jgi:hypothetical protein
MEDHRLPVDAQSLTIIEVNSIPMLAMHHYPMFGPSRNVSAELIECVAGAADIDVRRVTSQLTVRLTVTGRFNGSEYGRWLTRIASQFDISCDIGGMVSPDQLTATLWGPAGQVATTLRHAFNGPASADIFETYAEPVGRSSNGDGLATLPPPSMDDVISRATAPRSVADPTLSRARRSGSTLVRAAARKGGWRTRALGKHVVVCDDGTHRIAFRGFAGPGVSTVAELVCQNDAWVRRHLATRGLPVLETELVGAGDVEYAWQAAQRLGLPVIARLADEPIARGGHAVVTDRSSLVDFWDDRVRAGDPRHTRILLERQAPGTTVWQVAVVGSRVVAVDSAEPDLLRTGEGWLEVVGEIAYRAVAALPGARYGSVEIIADVSQPPATGLRIKRVDPLLRNWVGDDAAGAAIAQAILDLELRQAQKVST